jgi:hypothetical protein
MSDKAQSELCIIRSETETLAAPGDPHNSLNPNGIADLTTKNLAVYHTERQLIVRGFRTISLVT